MYPDLIVGRKLNSIEKMTKSEPWGQLWHVKDFWGLRPNIIRRSQYTQLRLIQRCFSVSNQNLIASFTKALNEIGKNLSITFEPIVKEYVKAIGKIPIVREVLVSEDEDESIIWTKIDTKPFEDSLRDPIYHAQLDILRNLPEDTQIDFRIVNINELSPDENIDDIVPRNAYMFWER